MQLLEREHILKSMRALLGQAIRGTGRVVLIAGEAGIGKSSLVEHFRADCGREARMLLGACDALFSPRPLGPLYDIARQTGGGLATLLDSDADRQAVFYAALSELGHTPTVAVFEDVHWADEATLDLLKFLGRRIHHTAALLVVTYRDDELGPQHPLRSLLGTFATSSATSRISLAPLSVDAVRRIVGERSVDARLLHRSTGGNPFFVTEVLASDGSISPTVRDAVLARAARLSQPAREILDIAAAIGVRVEPWLLASIATQMHAAEECLASGVLKVQGELIAFRHELARQTIWEAVPPHRRVELNRAVLCGLASSPLARSDPARLALHADAVNDGDAVLRYAPDAARLAGLRCAHREAAELLKLALSYAGELPPERQAPLWEQFARHATRIDRRSEAIAAVRESLVLSRKMGDALRECDNFVLLVVMLIQAGKNPEAEQASRAALALAESQLCVEHRAKAYEAQATVRMFDSDFADAIVWCERALALEGLTCQTAVWRRLQMRLAIAGMYFDYERATARLEELVSEARAAAQTDAGREIEVANQLSNLSLRSAWMYRFRRAQRYLAEGLAYTAERDLFTLHNLMLATQALTELYLGDWRHAEELASQVLARQGSSTIIRLPALETLGRLRSRQGKPGVEAALDESLVLAMETGSILRIGPVRAARAEAAWLDGDVQRAAAEACAAYDLALHKREPWIAGELLLWRTRAGHNVAIPDWVAVPFKLELQGDWRGAADEWQHMGCLYEQARALAAGDPAARLAALGIWDRLGAQPAAAALRAGLRSSGMPAIPRGPRPLTRGNRYGLTARQTEILALLGENMTNAEIAAQLHLSAKTVDHHVSAVLAKLDVRSRRDAGNMARTAALAS